MKNKRGPRRILEDIEKFQEKVFEHTFKKSTDSNLNVYLSDDPRKQVDLKLAANSDLMIPVDRCHRVLEGTCRIRIRRFKHNRALSNVSVESRTLGCYCRIHNKRFLEAQQSLITAHKIGFGFIGLRSFSQ